MSIALTISGTHPPSSENTPAVRQTSYLPGGNKSLLLSPLQKQLIHRPGECRGSELTEKTGL
jgi:hypothetical protein